MLAKEPAIKLNEDIEEKLASYFKQNLAGVSKMSFNKFVQDSLSFERAEEQIAFLRKGLPVALENKKLLEIGSGFGVFLINSRLKHQVMSYGAEPDFISRKITQKILSAFNLTPEIVSNNVGERLSYNDNSFDIVYSSNVLEHVRNPEQVLAEAIRVLKPNGYLFFVIPNFASWWEGHYGIIWWPNMPKHLARCYVKLLGRDARYLDGLQFITLRQIIQITRKFKNLAVLDYGWGVWDYRLTTLDFSGWAELYKLKKILQILRGAGLLKLIRFLGKKFDWLTPIILLAKKK